MANVNSNSNSDLNNLLQMLFHTVFWILPNKLHELIPASWGERKQIDQPMSIHDGHIAAIALTNGFSLATRNIKDFEHCGLELINPFELMAH
jgi:predicted nucleic acid-binding protein